MPAARLPGGGGVGGERRQPLDRLIEVAARAQLIDRLKGDVWILIRYGAEREGARLLTRSRGQRAHRFEPNHGLPILQPSHHLHHAAGALACGPHGEQSHLRIGIGHAADHDLFVCATGRRQGLQRQPPDASIFERVRCGLTRIGAASGIGRVDGRQRGERAQDLSRGVRQRGVLVHPQQRFEPLGHRQSIGHLVAAGGQIGERTLGTGDRVGIRVGEPSDALGERSPHLRLLLLVETGGEGDEQ